jgi:hypothetical protein
MYPSAYQLDKYITIDEMMVKYDGSDWWSKNDFQ